jgi:hypothetical protein
MRRIPRALVAIAGLLACDSTAMAVESSERCLAAYNLSSEAADAGDLVRAQQLLNECASDACASAIVLQRECVRASAQINEHIPTVITLAHGADGNDISDVEVSIDGQPVKARIDGREIRVNPGPHAFRFRSAEGEVVERRVVLAEREKGRVIEVKFAPSPMRSSAPPAEAARPVTPLFWVLGGVGVFSLASFAGFGLAGTSAYSDLNACAPMCRQGDVTTVRQRFVVADISLGLAVLALGGATYLFFTR